MQQIKVALTDKEIPNTLNALDMYAKFLISEKKMDRAYSISKVMLQIDIAIHDKNFCDAGDECAFKANKTRFFRIFEEQISKEATKNAA